jgi:hypothetical protein
MSTKQVLALLNSHVEGDEEQFLGVEPDSYPNFKNVNQRIIAPAVREVNGLGEFGCKGRADLPGPQGDGDSPVLVPKESRREKKATLRELPFSRVGRRARLGGTAETVTGAAAATASGEASTGRDDLAGTWQ